MTSNHFVKMVIIDRKCKVHYCEKESVNNE